MEMKTTYSIWYGPRNVSRADTKIFGPTTVREDAVAQFDQFTKTHPDRLWELREKTVMVETIKIHMPNEVEADA